jgi:phosphotransferase system  glucose/maltose/N-acetylglucosamine-specific IIC component
MVQANNDLHRLGVKLKLVYSLAGLLLGFSCIAAGVVLGLAGVAGHTTWTASLLGLSTSMSDAAPGVIVFVVGIFMVWITRFRVRETVEHFAANPPSPGQDTPAEPSRASNSRSGRVVTEYTTHGKF